MVFFLKEDFLLGKEAPFFSLFTDEEKEFSLSNCKGKPLILYFYPKNNTKGCTQQACDLRDQWKEFSKRSILVVGISRDSLVSHKKFKEKYNLNFPLLSDPEGVVCSLYGTWKEKSMYGKKYFGIERSTFLINSQGLISHIWRKVKVQNHWEEVLKSL